MVQEQTLSLATRTRTATGKAVAKLRQQDTLPGVVYGHGRPNVNVEMDLSQFAKIFAAAGRGSLINLTIDGGAIIPVVVHELSLNHLNDAMEHVDFYAVKMDEEITSEAKLIFTGEAPAVKTMGGTFLHNKDHVTIQCLPSKLIKEISIDISGLVSFTDTIKIKDIVLPDGVRISDTPDDIVATVAAPRTDEELAALNQTVTEDVSKVEGVVKPTAEEAEAADSKAKAEGKSEAKPKAEK